MGKEMDRTLNLLNRVLLGLTAIYAFMAVLGAFSSDPAVDHAEVVFLCYGATAFFCSYQVFLSSEKWRRFVPLSLMVVLLLVLLVASLACRSQGLPQALQLSLQLCVSDINTLTPSFLQVVCFRIGSSCMVSRLPLLVRRR